VPQPLPSLIPIFHPSLRLSLHFYFLTPPQTLIDKLLSGIVYWAVGFALAFGNSVAGGLLGTTGWALTGAAASSPAGLALWFESWAFLITATTIVSGCLAERAQFGAYLAYTPVMAGLVYPLAVHWALHGWLNRALPVRERGRGRGRKKARTHESGRTLALTHLPSSLSPPLITCLVPLHRLCGRVLRAPPGRRGGRGGGGHGGPPPGAV